MRRVCTTKDQLESLFRQLQEFPEHGWLISYDAYKPPRTLGQNRKLHAMIGDLADFTGRKNMKDWCKQLEVWPHILMTEMGEQKMIPKSESDLSRQEESDIIETLYALAATHLEPLGFEWTEPK